MNRSSTEVGKSDAGLVVGLAFNDLEVHLRRADEELYQARQAFDYLLECWGNYLRAEDGMSILRLWEDQPQFTLCRDTGQLSIRQHEPDVRGQGGECPVHGGDACLFQYVQVSALNRALEEAFNA